VESSKYSLSKDICGRDRLLEEKRRLDDAK
jgi:hypothetical protein